jgi:hypothetical protein
MALAGSVPAGHGQQPARAAVLQVRRSGTGPRGPLAGGGIPRVVYRRSRTPSTRRSAHGRCPLRVSRAAPPPAACRPRATPPLRASPPGEDAAPQDRLRQPRELARVARPGGAARAGLRRGGVPCLSRMRHPLLRVWPCPLHGLRPGVRDRVLVQGPRHLPLLQRSAHGADRRASCGSCHSAGPRATVGDLRAEAAAGLSGRPTPGRRSTHEDFS